MKLDNINKKTESQIHIAGCLTQIVPRHIAIATLRAYAFLGEAIEIEHNNGEKINNRDIARPSGLTDHQAAIATSLLCHKLRYKIERFMPLGTKIKIVDVGFACGEDPQSSWQSETMLEIDGWTIAPSIEFNHGYRGAIKWHSFDPEGDAIAENVTECEAVASLVAGISSHRVESFYMMEVGA